MRSLLGILHAERDLAEIVGSHGKRAYSSVTSRL
jgi:hypothetical protein